MSRTILKKIVHPEVPFPEVVTYLDTSFVSGQSLLWSNVSYHLKNKRSIEYINYSSDQDILFEVFGTDCQGSIRFHNLSIFDWENLNHISSLPSKIIQLENLKEENNIIVIDRVDASLKFLPETKLLRDINLLKQSKHVAQIILYCGEDLVLPSFLSSLNHISSAIVTLQSSKNHKHICSLFLKKKSGKILKTTEEYSLNKNLEIDSHREVKPDNKITEEESELCFQTTFNLKLTEDQKFAKNNLILPHTRIQTTGAQIYYIPDKEDDWDDEDPDEDLCEI